MAAHLQRKSHEVQIMLKEFIEIKFRTSVLEAWNWHHGFFVYQRKAGTDKKSHVNYAGHGNLVLIVCFDIDRVIGIKSIRHHANVKE